MKTKRTMTLAVAVLPVPVLLVAAILAAGFWPFPKPTDDGPKPKCMTELSSWETGRCPGGWRECPNGTCVPVCLPCTMRAQ